MYASVLLLALSPTINRRFHTPMAAVLILAIVLHSLSIAIRWIRIDHGPFINLFEILTSNLWSNMLGLTLFYIVARRSAIVIRYLAPVILIMMAWMLVVPVYDSHLPPTYDTVWLYFHVITGKVFFTLLMISTGMALHALVHRFRGNSDSELTFARASHALLAFSFVFESQMLLFGAVWAQDAWGRYWSWDPLETWAFATWIVVAFTLHTQVNTRYARIFIWLVPVCFILAFLTFYGVPFVSTAAHKGVV